MSTLSYTQNKNITENFIQICQSLQNNKIYDRPLITSNNKIKLFDDEEEYNTCDIDLFKFIKQLIKVLELTSSHIVIIFLYIDLISQKVFISKLNIRNIIYTASMISLKYLDDIVFSNSTFASLMNYKERKLAEMEIYFLEAIEFDLKVSCDDYRSCYNFLIL